MRHSYVSPVLYEVDYGVDQSRMTHILCMYIQEGHTYYLFFLYKGAIALLIDFWSSKITSYLCTSIVEDNPKTKST
jgi:hypothetical protein